MLTRLTLMSYFSLDFRSPRLRVPSIQQIDPNCFDAERGVLRLRSFS